MVAFIEAARDVYAERMSIALEAGDIGEAEAETTAALEIGREFMRRFLPQDVALPDEQVSGLPVIKSVARPPLIAPFPALHDGRLNSQCR